MSHIAFKASSLTFQVMSNRSIRNVIRARMTHTYPASNSRQMTWPQFFTARRRLQLLKRFAGLPFVLGFWMAEGFVLSMPIFDPTRTVMDIDPMILVGLTTIGGTLASYFFGAACTGWLWRTCRRDTATMLDQKQKDFYSRISKHRANVPPNPTQMSFNFDYYGEKVHSMRDYRLWLRRQRQLLSARIFPLK